MASPRGDGRRDAIAPADDLTLDPCARARAHLPRRLDVDVCGRERRGVGGRGVREPGLVLRAVDRPARLWPGDLHPASGQRHAAAGDARAARGNHRSRCGAGRAEPGRRSPVRRPRRPLRGRRVRDDLRRRAVRRSRARPGVRGAPRRTHRAAQPEFVPRSFGASPGGRGCRGGGAVRGPVRRRRRVQDDQRRARPRGRRPRAVVGGGPSYRRRRGRRLADRRGAPRRRRVRCARRRRRGLCGGCRRGSADRLGAI